jgi:hypothetical protein
VTITIVLSAEPEGCSVTLEGDGGTVTYEGLSRDEALMVARRAAETAC